MKKEFFSSFPAGKPVEEYSCFSSCSDEAKLRKAQESLMASCFHELGLRLHQLQLQNAQLQKRTGDGRDMDEET